MKRTILRALLVLAVAFPACGCMEFDYFFPWNWGLPRHTSKPVDQLPGKADVEQKKIQETRQDRELRERVREPEPAPAPAPQK
jgi:hypothetical protein